MKPTIEEIQVVYSHALKAKQEMRSNFSAVLEYTDIFSTMTDAKVTSLQGKRDIDSDILDSISTLQSYIMSSVFNRADQWADARLNEDLYRISMGKAIDANNLQGEIKRINTTLKKDTQNAFTYIQVSNYYNEVNKAIRDFITLGTGAFKVLSTGSLSKPFTYQYVDLDSFFIWEDEQSRPNNCFKNFYGKTGDFIYDNFGRKANLPAEVAEGDSSKTLDLVECVLPSYDETTSETKYHHFVYTIGFGEEVLYEELDYNPFVVFRWDTRKSTPWGIGLGMQLLDTFKTLKGFRILRQRQAELIANPPMNFTGNKEIAMKLSNKPNAFNYLGDGQMGDIIDYRPSGVVNVGLLPIDKDIQDLRNRIRSAFMSQPLGDVKDTRYQTAAAVQIRHEEFRKRFSSTYELMNTELLTPTFISPFIILASKGLLNTDLKEIPYTKINYINELTKASEVQKLQSMRAYAKQTNQLLQLNQSGILFKNEEMVDYFADKLGIEPDLLYTTQEKQAIVEQQQAMMQQQLQEQQGGMDGRQVSASSV